MVCGYLLSLDIGAVSDDVSNCGESDRLKTRATRAAEYETRDDRAAAKKRNITKYNVLQDPNFTPDMELHANLYRGRALENLNVGTAL